MAFTVAIDGPAAAGKGTISKEIARHFGFAHLDTGLLYRAVGAGVIAGRAPIDVARNLDVSELESASLRTPEVAQAASKVAAMSDVRAALVDFQRSFAKREGGAVLDGRDIGTVICPGADAKLFVTANDEVRARRRYLELSGKGMDVTPDGVLRDLRERDQRDREREAAPLVAAADAEILDTSELTIEAAVARAIEFISGKQKT